MKDVVYYPKCLICEAKKPEPSHFWKKHGIKEADYCYTYLPRYSKLTEKPIQFKSRDFYFSSDFADKNELKKWIKSNPDDALDYAKSIIAKRKKSGKITVAPSQVELRTLCSPSIIWYSDQCDYNEMCFDLGLSTRFSYLDTSIKKIVFKPLKLKYIIDTREQKPLSFEPHKTRIAKLSYGDYYCENSKWNHVYIERKSLSDAISTISGGYDRFCREIERALEDNSYLFIMVDENLTKALSFNYLPHISRKIKASPDYVFKRLRDLMQKYSNIQFVFCDSRQHSVDIINKIYSCSVDPKFFDWQYLLDKKII